MNLASKEFGYLVGGTTAATSWAKYFAMPYGSLSAAVAALCGIALTLSIATYFEHRQLGEQTGWLNFCAVVFGASGAGVAILLGVENLLWLLASVAIVAFVVSRLSLLIGRWLA